MVKNPETLAVDFIPRNHRPGKPRKRGLTEVRGPYYTPLGLNELRDLLESVGRWIDGLKYAGGAFAIMGPDYVQQLNRLAHEHDVYVSTGGWIEHVLRFDDAMVDRYIDACADLGFDVLELSTGFITLDTDDLLRLVERVRKAGLKPKPELGIQFGAGGDAPVEALESEGTRDVGWLIGRAERCFEAGAEQVMIESEGITENVRQWRTDVVERIVESLGVDRVMFEAADPAVFEWYIRTWGPNVNLFVDRSQIVQLECLRSGIWGTSRTFGRIASYHGSEA